MTQQTIDVEGLPEGWKAVAYRRPIGNIEYVFIDGEIRQAKPTDGVCLIVEKIQPRRIVLEETEKYHEPDDKAAIHTQIFNIDGVSAVKIISNKIWKEVKE